jgi:hypothetical protein
MGLGGQARAAVVDRADSTATLDDENEGADTTGHGKPPRVQWPQPHVYGAPAESYRPLTAPLRSPDKHPRAWTGRPC